MRKRKSYEVLAEFDMFPDPSAVKAVIESKLLTTLIPLDDQHKMTSTEESPVSIQASSALKVAYFKEKI